MCKSKLVSVVGTTASGKSSLGIELALHYGSEIVSADSRQVYRHLDLGTGKVTPEETQGIPHHLIDVIDLNQPFSMAEFQTLAYDAIDGIISRGKLPFLVGGTGLYTRSVVEGYELVDAPPNDELRAALADKSADELRHILRGYNVTDLAPDVSERRMIRMIEKLSAGFSAENENKPRYDVLQLGITFERDVLYRRISDFVLTATDGVEGKVVYNMLKQRELCAHEFRRKCHSRLLCQNFAASLAASQAIIAYFFPFVKRGSEM